MRDDQKICSTKLIGNYGLLFRQVNPNDFCWWWKLGYWLWWVCTVINGWYMQIYGGVGQRVFPGSCRGICKQQEQPCLEFYVRKYNFIALNSSWNQVYQAPPPIIYFRFMVSFKRNWYINTGYYKYKTWINVIPSCL